MLTRRAFKLAGYEATFCIAVDKPHPFKMRVTLGPSWIPAPTSVNSGARSKICTEAFARASASPVASPAIPPPAINTFSNMDGIVHGTYAVVALCNY